MTERCKSSTLITALNCVTETKRKPFVLCQTSYNVNNAMSQMSTAGSNSEKWHIYIFHSQLFSDRVQNTDHSPIVCSSSFYSTSVAFLLLIATQPLRTARPTIYQNIRLNLNRCAIANSQIFHKKWKEQGGKNVSTCDKSQIWSFVTIYDFQHFLHSCTNCKCTQTEVDRNLQGFKNLVQTVFMGEHVCNVNT